MDVRQTAANTGYLAVGVGVVAAQQLRDRAEDAAGDAAEFARAGADRSREIGTALRARVQDQALRARASLEPSLDGARAWADGAWEQAHASVEPTLERLNGRVLEAFEVLRERIGEFRMRSGFASPAESGSPSAEPTT